MLGLLGVLIKKTKREGERRLEKQKEKFEAVCLYLSFSLWSTFRLFFDQMDDSSYLWLEAWIKGSLHFSNIIYKLSCVLQWSYASWLFFLRFWHMTIHMNGCNSIKPLFLGLRIYTLTWGNCTQRTLAAIPNWTNDPFTLPFVSIFILLSFISACPSFSFPFSSTFLLLRFYVINIYNAWRMKTLILRFGIRVSIRWVRE